MSAEPRGWSGGIGRWWEMLRACRPRSRIPNRGGGGIGSNPLPPPLILRADILSKPLIVIALRV